MSATYGQDVVQNSMVLLKTPLAVFPKICLLGLALELATTTSERMLIGLLYLYDRNAIAML